MIAQAARTVPVAIDAPAPRRGRPPRAASYTQLAELSEKQHQVMALLVQGMTSKEISRHLGISPYTVDQRILLARGKLNVGSRLELVERYIYLTKNQDKTEFYEASIYGLQAMEQTIDKGKYYLSEAVESSPSVGGSPEAIGLPEGVEVENAASLRSQAGAYRLRAESRSGGRVLPVVFDSRFGPFLRLGATLGLALVLMAVWWAGAALLAVLAANLDH